MLAHPMNRPKLNSRTKKIVFGQEENKLVKWGGGEPIQLCPYCVKVKANWQRQILRHYNGLCLSFGSNWNGTKVMENKT